MPQFNVHGKPRTFCERNDNISSFLQVVMRGDMSRFVSVSTVETGRYVPNIEGPFEPGPYYPRYTQDGKRNYECVRPEGNS